MSKLTDMISRCLLLELRSPGSSPSGALTKEFRMLGKEQLDNVAARCVYCAISGNFTLLLPVQNTQIALPEKSLNPRFLNVSMCW